MIETPRLLLRRWRAEDLEPFALLNADPRVMEYFPTSLSEAETQAMMKTLEEKFEREGFSFWAAELKGDPRAPGAGELIGFVGLNIPGYPVPFAPCVEIGWRLAYEHWGRGYAQEGARASLDYGFKTLGLSEIVSFTAVANARSRHVMERIGMVRDVNGDFDHPRLAEGHPLRRHVLYRVKK
jgi:RimJ/RimL family protein N-acetyltransferase